MTTLQWDVSSSHSFLGKKPTGFFVRLRGKCPKAQSLHGGWLRKLQNTENR